jgi:hypothetical protein
MTLEEGGMRRIFTALVIVATSAALGTAAARAKEIGAIVLTGPGIDGSMQLNDSDVARWHNLNIRQPRLDSAPTSDLGEMYSATWQVGACYSGAFPPRIPVEIYPFAQGGMLLHVEPGSLGCARGLIDPGWWRAKPSLAPLLERYGVPTQDPATPSAAATVGQPAPRLAPYAAGVVLLTVLLAAIVLSRRWIAREAIGREPIRR